MKTFQKQSILFATILFLASCGGGKNDSSSGNKGEDSSQKDTATASSKKDQEEMTAAKFANAVRKKILEKAKKEGGHLKFPDPRNRDDSLEVKLKKVVEASVSKAGKNVRYVCAKFKGVENGKDYDIDFFLEGNKPSSLKPARKPLVHKVDGKARYKYVEKEDGFKEPKRIEEKQKEAKGSDKDQKKKKKNMKKAKEAEEGKAGIK